MIDAGRRDPDHGRQRYSAGCRTVRAVEEVTIAAGDLSAKIITLGAIVRDVRLAGVDHPLVLGFDDLDGLSPPLPVFRRGGRPLRQPHRRWPLHARRASRISSPSTRRAAPSSTAGRTASAGGTGGSPPTMAASVTLDARERRRRPGLSRQCSRRPAATRSRRLSTLRFEAEATTDAPTIVNLAQHSYFNLDDSADILDHRVAHRRRRLHPDRRVSRSHRRDPAGRRHRLRPPQRSPRSA